MRLCSLIGLIVLIARVPSAFAADALPLTLPVWGVSLQPPAGLPRVIEGDEHVLARWTEINTKTEKPAREIALEIHDPGDRTFAQFVRFLALSWGPIDTIVPARLGDAPAFHVKVQRKGDAIQPVEGYICKFGKNAYVLTARESAGTSAAPLLAPMAAGWKWIPIDEPSKHTALGRKEVKLTDVFSLDLPDAARVFENKPDPRREKQQWVALREFVLVMESVKRPVPDYVAVVEVYTDAIPIRVERWRDVWATFISTAFGPFENLKFADAGKEPTRMLTPLQTPKKKGENLKTWDHVKRARWGLVQINEREYAVIGFYYYTEDAEKVKTYEAMTEAILNSAKTRERSRFDE